MLVLRRYVLLFVLLKCGGAFCLKKCKTQPATCYDAFSSLPFVSLCLCGTVIPDNHIKREARTGPAYMTIVWHLGPVTKALMFPKVSGTSTASVLTYNRDLLQQQMHDPNAGICMATVLDAVVNKSLTKWTNSCRRS